MLLSNIDVTLRVLDVLGQIGRLIVKVKADPSETGAFGIELVMHGALPLARPQARICCHSFASSLTWIELKCQSHLQLGAQAVMAWADMLVADDPLVDSHAVLLM